MTTGRVSPKGLEKMHHKERLKRSLVSIITVAAAIWIGSSKVAPALEQKANAIYTGGDIITIKEGKTSYRAP